MKRPNWKLYSLMIRIDLWVILLCLLGAIILSLFLFDSTYPVFKYSLLCINIITYAILIASTIVLIVVIRFWRNKLLGAISNYTKVACSISCLACSFSILLSIEYLIYTHNQDNFYIEKNYIETSTNDKVFDVKRGINYCEEYINKYIHIFEELKNKKYIKYNNIEDFYFTIIDCDTVEINIYRKETIGSGTNGICINSGLDNAEDIGISLNNESGHIPQPKSNVILESMQRNENINGNDFRLLVHQKIERYQDKIKEYKTILKDELVVTFGDFIIYNIFNPSITGNKTHNFIRLIFLLQTIVVTFFSGYIYQTLYKILDGEDNKKPEA